MRRHPYRPTLEGSVTGTEVQLAVLDLLQKYEVLPLTYITHALANYEYVRKVVRELNDKGYIGVPADAMPPTRNGPVLRVLPYWLLPKGVSLLKQHGMYNGRTLTTRSFQHKFMASTILYSFGIADTIEGLKLITPEDVLAHELCPEQTRKSPAPWVIHTSPKLVPDAPVFGLEYRDGKKVTLFFHGFEADRGGEQLQSAADRQSIDDKLYRYAQYLNTQGYTRQYGLNQCWILFFVSKKGRIKGVLERIHAICPELEEYIFVMYWPDFNAPELPIPAPTAITEDYMKVGGTFNILGSLKAELERKVSWTPRKHANYSPEETTSPPN